jgi:sugar lactone lactonase YvrE
LDIWSKPTVFRLEPATGAFRHWSPGITVTGMARRQGGGFVFASRTGLYLWDEWTDEHQFLGDPEADSPNVRFNDGSADRQGRFWAGSTYPDDQSRAEGSLYRLDTDHSVHTICRCRTRSPAVSAGRI